MKWENKDIEFILKIIVTTYNESKSYLLTDCHVRHRWHSQ